MNILHLIWEFLFSLVEFIVRWFLPANYKSVEGEVCLITGGGSGLGRLMAIEFARRGAKVIIWGRSKTSLEQTEQLVREMGGSVFSDVCDVASYDQIKDAAQRARKQFGEITILVNNAGMVYCKELLELSDQQIEQIFNVNSLAHFRTIREFLPSMKKSDHGHIVNVASVVGLSASPGMPAYIASKHAAVGLSQALYFDLQKEQCNGVKTTLVCPYHIHTGMFTGFKIDKEWLMPSLQPEETVEAIMHAVLTNRPFVAVPRLMYVSYNIASWLPMRLQASIYRFMGINEAVDGFVPSRIYQKA